MSRQNPFDWGLPSLSFTNFAGLQDANPQLLRNQTYTFSDNVVWTHGKHTWRWGGDFRRVQLNTETSSNARGSFIFSGSIRRRLIGSGSQQCRHGLRLCRFPAGIAADNLRAVRAGQLPFPRQLLGSVRAGRVESSRKSDPESWRSLRIRFALHRRNNRIANLDLSPGVLNPHLGAPAVAAWSARTSWAL